MSTQKKSSATATMRDGLPVRYWRFRTFVSIGQIAVVTLAIGGAILWALTDGNGARVWQDYFQFASGISDFAHNVWRLPWE